MRRKPFFCGFLCAYCIAWGLKMKFYLLTDDPDSLVGLRLAGIEGKLLQSGADALSEIEKLCTDSEIGMILITPNIAKMLGGSLTELKKRNSPLITEIPDSNPQNNSSDNVTDYIRNAVGIKF